MSKKKSKKHIIIPLALFIYLIAMAIYTYPKGDNPEVSLTQYYITIGITLVLIVAASYFIKKREEHKQKYEDEG